MASLYISSASANPLILQNSIKKHPHQLLRKLSVASHQLSSTLITFNPLGVSVSKRNEMKLTQKKGKRAFGAVCYAGAGAFSASNLQWISTISSVILMVSKGTAIHKSFLVPLLALQAPSTVISWMKGDYGIWTAFTALLFRLFFFIPGELELPFIALLLTIVAPYQVMNLRATQEGGIIALVIAGYLAFQHFSRAGNLQRAFDQGSIVATLAIICVTVISCFFLV